MTFALITLACLVPLAGLAGWSLGRSEAHGKIAAQHRELAAAWGKLGQAASEVKKLYAEMPTALCPQHARARLAAPVTRNEKETDK